MSAGRREAHWRHPNPTGPRINCAIPPHTHTHTPTHPHTHPPTHHPTHPPPPHTPSTYALYRRSRTYKGATVVGPCTCRTGIKPGLVFAAHCNRQLHLHHCIRTHLHDYRDLREAAQGTLEKKQCGGDVDLTASLEFPSCPQQMPSAPPTPPRPQANVRSTENCSSRF